MRNANFDIAYEYVRQRILSGEYRPGQALLAKPLASETGVSRTPVRDALRQLATDGLVTIQVRLGASVKRMGIREFKEMCQVRLALESHAAALAASNRTDAELQAIHAPLAGMHEITQRLARRDKEEDALLEELAREDVRFHLAIIAAAKNDLIKKEILRLQLINRVVAGPAAERGGKQTLPKKENDERRQVALASHGEIYEAIEQLDGGKAKKAMERHLQRVIDYKLFNMSRASSGVFGDEYRADEQSYLA